MQTTFEINLKNFQQDINSILSIYPQASHAKLVLEDNINSDNNEELLNEFKLLRKKFSSFKIPKNVDISDLANEMLDQ